MSVRPSAVAGVFYPSDKIALSSMLDGFLKDLGFYGKNPKIIISPHAGYVYSGSIAASAYKQLAGLDKNKRYRVLIMGASHRVYFHGIAFSPAGFFATPLGDVRVDKEAIQEFVNSSPFAFFSEEAHVFEHSIETQLPFLQKTLQNFSIIPAVYSDCDVSEVGETLEYFLKDENTFAIMSADLSHFHDYDTAKKMDLGVINAIENQKISAISNEHTCGKNGICAALNYAKKHNLKQKTLDYKNSGDVTDDKKSVVGYMSAIFY